jgi:hypothetical protein
LRCFARNSRNFGTSFFDAGGVHVSAVDLQFAPNRGAGGIRQVVGVMSSNARVTAALANPAPRARGDRWVESFALATIDRAGAVTADLGSLPGMEFAMDEYPRPVWLGATAAFANDDEVIIEAGLAGAAIGGQTPHGKAVFRQRPVNDLKLQVEVQDVNLPAGTVLNVFVGGQQFATLTIDSLRAGRVERETERGQSVPAVTNGNYNVTVTNCGGQVSNGIQFTALTATLITVTFTVFTASPTQVGDYIFLTGNTVELGNWATTWDGAVGPMLTPNYPNWFLTASVPAGQTLQFKFIKIAANGTVTWEAGANHTYTVPSSGTGFVNVNWQY